MKKLSISMTPWETALGWFYWPFQLLFLPLLLHLGNGLLKTPLSEERLNFVFFCVNFVFLTVALNRFLIRSGKAALRRPMRTLQWAFIGFGVYYAASYLIGILILQLSPDFLNANDSTIADMLIEEPTLISVGTVILAPVAEELMYRGLIFRSLYNRSRAAAYILSTLVFAAIHLLGYITVYDPLTMALCLLQYLPAGLCLGWVYARSDTIWAPILTHIAVNQMAVLSLTT